MLFLLLEKLHTTHDADKLKMFANALANAGSIDFKTDDKEEYIRVLRDLSLNDLKILNDDRLRGWLPHTHSIEYAPEVMSSLSRLQGMGLVLETLKPPYDPRGTSGISRLDAQMALSELFKNPPKKTYHLSGFGERFLRFISDNANQNTAPVRDTRVP